MNRDFQIWQLERQLIVQRLTIYLLTSSILFLGFVAVRTSWLGILVAFMGLISCGLAWQYFRYLSTRLNGLESRLGIQLECSLKRIKGRDIASKVFPPFFAVIWLGALIFSILFVFN